MLLSQKLYIMPIIRIDEKLQPTCLIADQLFFQVLVLYIYMYMGHTLSMYTQMI